VGEGRIKGQKVRRKCLKWEKRGPGVQDSSGKNRRQKLYIVDFGLKDWSTGERRQN
jgi:hypothetical protein